MSTPPRRQPVYLEIADDLRGRIERGELQSGQKLPTERELAEHYGVARMTVRHSLDVLQIEGLIDRRRGRTGGTFVRIVPPLLELTRLDGFLPQLRDRGQTVTSHVLIAEETTASPTVATRLALRNGDPVHRLMRVRRVDDVPVLIEESFIPRTLFPDLLDGDLSFSLPDLLAAYDRRPIRKEEAVAPSVATALEQERLELTRNLPLLRITRTSFDASGAIVEYSEDTLRSDVARVQVVTTS
ncbi:GntR family transcriptional regulator [Corynebacterium sp.]|uniref:GntR family transcriptional regulator n=1 Tax=Corynebacterium sp. TaxID=1720 RepID=UPI003735FF18